MKLQKLILALLASLSLLVGCSKDDNPVTPPPAAGSTTLVGSLAGSNGSGGTQSGTLTLSFATAKRLAAAGDTSNVSGTLYIAPDTITLSGIYVASTGYLSVSGGGYTITGVLSDGKLNASYSGPGGYGGTVAASSSGSGHTVTVFCGTSTETVGGSNTGTFNMIVDGASITIITSDGLTFYGTVSSGTVTIYLAGTSGTVLATGTVEGTHASGTFDTPDSIHGEWVADVCH